MERELALNYGCQAYWRSIRHGTVLCVDQTASEATSPPTASTPWFMPPPWFVFTGGWITMAKKRSHGGERIGSRMEVYRRDYSRCDVAGLPELPWKCQWPRLRHAEACYYAVVSVAPLAVFSLHRYTGDCHGYSHHVLPYLWPSALLGRIARHRLNPL
jgi:hypothetical protein